MNRFSTGQKAMMNRLMVAAGRTVTYSYGEITGQNPPTYTALGQATFSTANNQGMWVGNTLYRREAKNPGGATVVHGDRDYFCRVADFLALVPQSNSALPVTPIKGDRISDTDDDGNPAVYEVNTPTGEPVFRYSDQTRQEFRIHCKRVS